LRSVHFTHDAIAGNSPYRDENLAVVYRWVPKADISPSLANVRFTPKSGHR